MLCNERSIATCDAHLTFQSVIDYWGACSDTGIPGTILSCNVVATCQFNSHNCATKKVNKQVQAKIRNFKLN